VTNATSISATIAAAPSAGDARAVVTGIGAISPVGHGSAETWKAVLQGRSGIAPISRFDAAGFTCGLAGEITDYEDTAAVGPRLVPQTDRSTRLSFAAAEEALADAGVDPADLDPFAAGITTANFAGGFEFGERELRQLWSRGGAYVSAYQSFAWFYAVNTGQLSIRHGLKGTSGVVVADECGGLEAVALARRNIRGGTPVQLTGAVDFSLCSWGMAALQTSRRLSTATDSSQAYLPFDDRASGAVPGEGGALLVLEDEHHARNRGADAYAAVTGHAASFDGDPGSHAGVVRCLRTTLADAGLEPRDVDVVLADGAGTLAADQQEARALTEVFGERRVPVTVPKTATGRLLSGGAALDVAWAVLALRHGTVPPTLHVTYPTDGPLDLVVGEARPGDLRHALVLARGHGGLCSALVLTRC
jgi:minimal PKS chain-length factor (CLF/KS beta)